MKSWSWIVRAELDMYYHFPWLEAIFGAFFAIGILFTFGNLGSRIHLVISQDPMLHGPVAVDAYLGVLETSAMEIIFSAFNSAMIVIAFILPIIMAFSLAEPLQNGFIRTLLSYPLTKLQILLSKLTIANVLMSTLAVSCCTLLVMLVLPGPKDILGMLLVSLGLVIGVFTVSSTTLLVSLVTRSPLSTSIVSAGTWLLVMFASAVQPTDSLMRGILNPVLLVTDFLSNANPELLVTPVIWILGLFMSIGLAAFILSYIIFKRAEL